MLTTPRVHLVALCIIGITFCLALSQPQVGELSVRRSFWFESHGRDDMREWRAAIMKGAQYIKIDISIRYIPAECHIQTRLPPSPTNYSEGCFVLCHYYSNKTTDFNTTYDIVHFIDDAANDDLLSGAYGNLIFQMCIKHEPPFEAPTDPSTRGYKWIRLMDEFYKLMTPILARPNRRHVQFVFDSLPYDEPGVYVAHWPLWNATWTGNFLEASDNNVTLGNNIFQMVNMEVTWLNSWNQLAAGGFYKFAQPLYAFVGWEPASEAAILRFHELFLGYNFTNPHGVLIAYNPDPSAFHTITANTTKRFAHDPFGSPNMSYAVSGVARVGSEHVLITAAVDASGSAELSVHQHGPMSTMQHLYTGGTTALSDSARLQSLHARASHSTCGHGSQQQCNYSVDVWVADVAGCVAPLTLHLERLPSGWLSVGSFAQATDSNRSCPSPLSPPAGDSLVATARLETSSPYDPPRQQQQRRSDVGGVVTTLLPFLTLGAGPLPNISGWGLTLSGWVEVDVEVTGSASRSRSRTVVPFEGVSLLSGFQIPFDVSSLAVAAVVLGTDAEGARLNTTVAITWADTNRQTFVALAALVVAVDFFSVPKTVGVEEIVWTEPSATPAPVKLGVGESPSAAMLPARPGDPNREPWLIVTYGESFCYNNMIVDDDFGPFRGDKICSLQNASFFEMGQQPVQSYVFGRLGAYIAGLESQLSNPQRQGLATTCSDTLFQGMFDIAHHASVSLLPKVERLDWYVRDEGFLAVATARSLTQTWTTACGTPIPHGGKILVDAFPLFGTYNVSALYAQ